MKFITNLDDKVWNDLLEEEKNHQIITIAHNPSLGSILAKTFGYSYKNLLIKKNNETIGVMPIILMGNKVVSMPHFSYGGAILVDKLTEDIDFSTVFKDKKFEIRSFTKLTENVYDKKISCILNVQDSEKDQIMGLRSKLRQKIRKSNKLGYTKKTGGLELLNDFYGLYARKMFQFGSPPIGKIFFQNLLKEYQFGDAQITVLYDKNKVIAVCMALSYLNFNEVCWSATDSNYDKFNVHAFICWEMLKTSIEKKHTYFSFGRSTIDSNNHKFKKQWNPIELPIYYNYSEPQGKSIKELSFLNKLWKLQPIGTSVFLGHIVSKYVY